MRPRPHHGQRYGIASAPETAERLFDRFFRGDASHSRTIEGTGLGLAIVAQHRPRSRRNVSAAARPEGGSVFTITCRRSTCPPKRRSSHRNSMTRWVGRYDRAVRRPRRLRRAAASLSVYSGSFILPSPARKQFVCRPAIKASSRSGPGARSGDHDQGLGPPNVQFDTDVKPSSAAPSGNLGTPQNPPLRLDSARENHDPRSGRRKPPGTLAPRRFSVRVGLSRRRTRSSAHRDACGSRITVMCRLDRHSRHPHPRGAGVIRSTIFMAARCRGQPRREHADHQRDERRVHLNDERRLDVTIQVSTAARARQQREHGLSNKPRPADRSDHGVGIDRLRQRHLRSRTSPV